MADDTSTQWAGCSHQYLTVIGDSGWICAKCSVPVLALSMPIPLPLIAAALSKLAGEAA